MFTINLTDLKFYSFHGVYEEEQLVGGEYLVNADVSIDAIEKIVSIHQTVNYVTVYHVIKKQMNNPTPLLETLAQNMADEIKLLDARIRSIIISIKKIDPPIRSFSGSVGVTYSLNI